MITGSVHLYSTIVLYSNNWFSFCTPISTYVHDNQICTPVLYCNSWFCTPVLYFDKQLCTYTCAVMTSVFQELLEGGTLSYRDTLLATGTVFKILSGQGEALNIDPASFYTQLYSSLLSLSVLTSPSSLPLAMSSLHDMLVTRRKKVMITDF